MKRFAATQISHLFSALLITGVLLNLCLAPATSFCRTVHSTQPDAESFASATGGTHSPALTTAPRAHSEVPASKQKRLRHPALDLTALPAKSFQLSSLSLSQRVLDESQFVFHPSFSVRPKGRAPPVSL